MITRAQRCLDCPISYHITCMPPSCSFHELAMLCHEHAYTSKLPYLDAEYSIQATVEADAEKKMERIRRREERRAAARSGGGGALLSDEEASACDDDVENPFLPGLVGSTVLYEEEELAEYLEGKDGEDASRRRKRRRQFDYCLPVDFKELVSRVVSRSQL